MVEDTVLDDTIADVIDDVNDKRKSGPMHLSAPSSSLIRPFSDDLYSCRINQRLPNDTQIRDKTRAMPVLASMCGSINTCLSFSSA